VSGAGARGRTTAAERESWSGLRERRTAEPGAEEAYEAARLAFELGTAVRELRLEPGAAGVGRGDDAVGGGTRFEAGGTVPTLAMLGRIAKALNADLTVRVEGVLMGRAPGRRA
jgi:hypothetical protein